jgi:DNA-binding beta-propeller fold protein YncE
MLHFNWLRNLVRLGKASPVRPRRRWRACFEALEDRCCPSVDLLVSSIASSSVLRYDGTTGAFRDTFTSGNGLLDPVGIAVGPDGNVYVAGRDSNDILKYDGTSGALLSTFVASGSGSLDGPHDIAFGPDGNLYVASGFNGEVLRYDGSTGAFLSTFVGTGIGGLGFPHGLTFGPDGNLYVGDRDGNDVLRYDGKTGHFLGTFVAPGSGGLSVTTGVAFGPDGNLYVDSFNTNSVLEYNGTTGAFITAFATGGGLDGPQGLVFGPDGNLYVSSFNTNSVLQFNGQTGAFLSTFASGNGLSGPTYLAFRDTDATVTLTSSTSTPVVGQSVTFTAQVHPVFSTISPTGSVAFSIDGVSQGSVPLANGLATLTTTSLTAGSHTVTATYSGDSFFASSSPTSLSETVSKASDTVTLSASPPSPVSGQSVTSTTTVTPAAPGSTPTGIVTFTIDGSPQPPVSLVNGAASLTTAFTAGSHTITASYSGDSVYLGGSSGTLTEKVGQASAGAALSSSNSTSVFGQAVTFTATVTAVAPGAGTPTGTVTFLIDGNAQKPVSLSGGKASLTTAALNAGPHTIAAVYNGDSNFQSATSSKVTQQVNPANTTLSLSVSDTKSVLGEIVTFSANVGAVAPGAGAPGGTVTFSVDGQAKATATLVNGQATFSTATLTLGSHTITAVYNGSNNFNVSPKASVTLTVGATRTKTITTLVSSEPISRHHESVTFTATVTAADRKAGTPQGTVTFYVDGVAVYTATLHDGRARFTTSDLSIGKHIVTAVYSGTSTFQGSSSNPFVDIVLPRGHHHHHHHHHHDGDHDGDDGDCG